MSARLNQFISEGNECDSVVAVDRWQARVLPYLDASQLEKEAAEQYIENKDRPGINVYLQENGQWMAIPGTDCDGPMFTLGMQGKGYLYCGVITEDRPYVKIMVGETEAQIFDLNDKKRVWYVVQKSRGLIVQGSFASGEQVQF